MHMYNTKLAKQTGITLNDILSKVSEYDIYARYLGNFKVGAIYNSPFRKDKNPSFGTYYGRNGNLMFKDHGANISGDIVKFVSLKTGITNYNEILNVIYRDLKIKNITTRTVTKEDSNTGEKVIGIVRQPFTAVDIDYWNKFAITEKTLKKFNVYSIKYYLCNGIVKAIYKDENPMFAYKVYDHFKIYRPLADKRLKWRNNLTEYDVQGFEQLPKTGNILFITKSLKDVMALYEMGYNAISPGSETTFIPDEALDIVLKRFKRIIILFDRDATGVRESRARSLKTGLEAMFVHKRYGTKDISDTIAKWGQHEVKQWLNKTL